MDPWGYDCFALLPGDEQVGVFLQARIIRAVETTQGDMNYREIWEFGNQFNHAHICGWIWCNRREKKEEKRLLFYRKNNNFLFVPSENKTKLRSAKKVKHNAFKGGLDVDRSITRSYIKQEAEDSKEYVKSALYSPVKTESSSLEIRERKYWNLYIDNIVFFYTTIYSLDMIYSLTNGCQKETL